VDDLDTHLDCRASVSFDVNRSVEPERGLAILGGTLIDGTGGRPVPDAALLIEGERIRFVGPRTSLTVPESADVVNAAGKFIIPGLIDTNAHLTLFVPSPTPFYETLVRYAPLNRELAVAAAQLHLRHGVTTVRDSYGVLPALQGARSAIESGAVAGPRILAAGNIVGWGGPFSMTIGTGIPSRPAHYSELTRFQEGYNELVTQGTGEELLAMTRQELGDAIDRYIEKGPDFIKYGGTAHWSNPTLIGFSAGSQRLIVEHAHNRGLPVETHATSLEGMREAIEAGIDLIQHPELLNPREISDELVSLIRERNVICSVVPNVIAGQAWDNHIVQEREARSRLETNRAVGGSEPDTAWSRHRRNLDLDIWGMRARRRSVERLIAAGCLITIGTDNYIDVAPEFQRAPKASAQEPGVGTLLGLQGLVELGMTPMAAIQAATANGAIACRAEQQLGTLVVGKFADLIVLDADPLQNIANVQRSSVVISRGRVVDLTRLPVQSVYEVIGAA
jgi:imidazolonepropionase-like amidohydrolase